MKYIRELGDLNAIGTSKGVQSRSMSSGRLPVEFCRRAVSHREKQSGHKVKVGEGKQTNKNTNK